MHCKDKLIIFLISNVLLCSFLKKVKKIILSEFSIKKERKKERKKKNVCESQKIYTSQDHRDQLKLSHTWESVAQPDLAVNTSWNERDSA